MKKHYKIRFKNTKNQLDFLVDKNTSNIQKILKFNYEKKLKVYCNCIHNEKNQLSIRKKDSLYFLARWPNTGNEHKIDCSFYFDSIFSGRASYIDQVIIENYDNNSFTLKLSKLHASLDNNLHTLPYSDNPTVNKTEKINHISLKGLVNFLWDEVNLNVWHKKMDGRRNINVINNLLFNQSKNINVNKLALHNSLFLTSPNNKNNPKTLQLLDHNNKIFLDTLNEKKRLIIISELDQYDETLNYIKLKHFTGAPFLNINNEIKNLISLNFSFELEHLKHNGKTILISLIEPTKIKDETKSAKVIDLALMAVSERYIPILNKWDEELENKLYEENRSFVKFLQYDASHKNADFGIIDTDLNFNLPVIIYNSAQPEERKRAKNIKNFFTNKYGPNFYIAWDTHTIKLENLIIPKTFFFKEDT